MGRFFAVIAMLAIVTTGCTAISSQRTAESIQEHRLLAHAIVTLAITKIVHAHPSWGPRIAEAAVVAQGSIPPGHSVQVVDLAVFLRNILPVDRFGAEYQELIDVLTATLIDESQAAFAGKVVPVGIGATGQEVLQWVRTAALVAQ
jgi:hypothetical protein